MKREFRLTKLKDFKRVRRLGTSYAHPLIVLIVYPNQDVRNRFGVAAGKTVGNAVKRNRAKRLLRAAIMATHTEIDQGWDIVLIARRPIADASFHNVSQSLRTLLDRARLISG